MNKWNVAVYLRLSSDDGDKAESNSIINQKSLIKAFIKKDINVNEIYYYTDDGYSGTTFNRPDFQRMLNDMKNGKINCVIVKDLSRLGRNYIEVGNYIEQIFPLYNVRFIAINDNVDSYKDPKSVNNVIVPFKNLMNDEYARDISNKVRSVLDNKKEKGQFIGSFAPYGYYRNPNDKHKFIVDKDAEKVIKKIFNMILSGKSKKDVVDELNSLNISTPRVHKIEKSNFKCDINESVRKWDSKKLDEILKNRTYTGDLVQGVRKKISHKIHTAKRVKSDNWIIVPNHHKPIISKQDFEKVQEILYERGIRVHKNNEYDVFAGHLRCNECDNNLVIRKSKGYEYYYCSSYLKHKNCTAHSYRKKDLEQEVINVMNNFRLLIKDLDINISKLLGQTETNYDLEIIKNKIDNIDIKLKDIHTLRKTIKEDLKEKLISEEEYWEYTSEYSRNIKDLKEERNKLEDKLSTINCESHNDIKWIEEMKNIKEIKKLNKIMLDELIEDIVIDEQKNIRIIFKCEDKYFEALDFIKRNKYDIMPLSENAI